LKRLKIEIIHDIVCSWCPIGYANLRQALENTNTKAHLHFLPFELNPSMADEGQDINQHLAERNQWDQAKLHAYRQQLLAVAKAAGVAMDFSKRTHYYNSSKAHLLMHYSESSCKQQLMNELLIDAYFNRGLNISDTSVLLKLADQAGLNRVLTKRVLEGISPNEGLVRKMNRVKTLGLSGVPAFIFNESSLVKGSNSVEYFETVISELNTEAVA